MNTKENIYSNSEIFDFERTQKQNILLNHRMYNKLRGKKKLKFYC